MTSSPAKPARAPSEEARELRPHQRDARRIAAEVIGTWEDADDPDMDKLELAFSQALERFAADSLSTALPQDAGALPDAAYADEVGGRYLIEDYDTAVKILEPVSRGDVTGENRRVLVPKMYREIARAIGDARKAAISTALLNPSEEVVEAGARALWGDDNGEWDTWPQVPDVSDFLLTKGEYREQARQVLRVAAMKITGRTDQ